MLIKKFNTLFHRTSRVQERELELWSSLFALTKQQQTFVKALQPVLAELNNPLLQQSNQIIALDSILRKAEGVLLSKLDTIQHSQIKHQIEENLK
ncbi:hypothetical protein [Rodentibacter pneumotropicus]|uniref:Uncharacterized protein n=1 Tax=Rodentibacter pneumotropicus TaxID=758 RepID=A0A4S2PZ76_9PAST|nr:hypothetical protein [Rodentibacter pneumotropicus]THA09413.1 hypothetical protein D3M77_02040 [Rodentibacter pneumotropicus]THA18033.1 hypothetical protein D3M76_00245 [Rodentibacter pneumotropicus]